MSHQDCSLSLGAIYLRPNHSRKEGLPVGPSLRRRICSLTWTPNATLKAVLNLPSSLSPRRLILPPMDLGGTNAFDSEYGGLNAPRTQGKADGNVESLGHRRQHGRYTN